jgi:hypothetical protein
VSMHAETITIFRKPSRPTLSHPRPITSLCPRCVAIFSNFPKYPT